MLIVVGLVVALTACGSDDSDSRGTASPTASNPSDLSPLAGGVGAARRYLQKTGVDGKRGDFTDPRSCSEINGDTDGDFCVHENFSTYAAGIVILRIARANKPNQGVWEMRLSLTDGQWQVKSVEPFGIDE